jgi:N-acetylmuramoyl-L-alanine amidase
MAAAGRAGDWRLAGCQRVAFYLNGRPSPVDSAELLDTLSRYGYQVTPEMTPRNRNGHYGLSDALPPGALGWRRRCETQAIAEALLEKYGQG